MFRIGQSTDIHQLVPNRKLVLGGVEIKSDKGLLGHSDADALLHAIIEAIIGAMGLKDIGTHFSDKDERYRGISSMVLLAKTYEMMNDHGYMIGNVDSLILVETIKMAPYIDKMRVNIAKVLHTDINQINVKATRGEGLGFIGRSEGIMAQAVVLLVSKNG